MTYQTKNSYKNRDNQPLTNPAQLQKINVNKFLKELVKYLFQISKTLTIGFIDSPIKQTETILLENFDTKTYQFYSISRDFDKKDQNHYVGMVDDFIKNYQVKFNFFFLDTNEGLTKVSNTVENMLSNNMFLNYSIVAITIVARGIHRPSKNVSCAEYANNKLLELFNKYQYYAGMVAVPDNLVVEGKTIKKTNLPINCTYNGGLVKGMQVGAGPTYSFIYQLVTNSY